MTEKILFIHGTGVRAAAFERSLALVAKKVKTYLPRYEVVGCNWGDAFGARLNAQGKSIPGYVDQGAASTAVEAAAMARWTLLAEDPLLELRVTVLPLPLGGSQGPNVWAKLKKAGEDAKGFCRVTGVRPSFAPVRSSPSVGTDLSRQGVKLVSE